MQATESESELLKLYDTYKSETWKCKTHEQRENLMNMWDASFRTMNTTLEEVKALKSKKWVAQAKTAFAACFEMPHDRTAFELKHTISTTGDDNCASLVVDDGLSYDDYPGFVHVSPHRAILVWRQKSSFGDWLVADRNIGFGPAEVAVFRDGTFRGRHFVDGGLIAGHKNWRKRCKAHNHWITRIMKK